MAVVSPSTVFPLAGYERLCFLKNVVDHPQITIGDYTYYDDFEDVANFERRVRYLFGFTGDRLIIGKFCMIASGVEFVMNGANRGLYINWVVNHSKLQFMPSNAKTEAPASANGRFRLEVFKCSTSTNCLWPCAVLRCRYQ
ncbi:MAG TPA: hypothetical protein VF629_15055 [Hymenobacter sp.]|jgi:hypothetical protein|uniref:hypothetical protein n=1 Tax=Hymenobacter sp. TaxID=1898978 RepID=UPI002EDA0ADF